MKILFNTLTSTFKAYPRADAQTVVGLSPDFLVYDLLQEDPPAYDKATHFLVRIDTPDHTAKTLTYSWRADPLATPADPTPTPDQTPGEELVPTFVTDKQMLYWLVDNKKYQRVLEIINTITDPTEKLKAQFQFQRSSIIYRKHPMTLFVMERIPQTPAETDAAFIAMSKIAV